MKRPRILSMRSSRSLSIGLTLALAGGLAVGTSASFNGSASNRDNTLATASLTAPADLAAAPAGNGVALTWGAGSFGGGTGFGHRVMSRTIGVEADPRDGIDGPSDTCAASDTFTTSAARTAAAVTSATHANAAARVAGSYACYRVDAEYPAAPATSQWYSQTGNPTAVVMLGHVVKSIVAHNGCMALTAQMGRRYRDNKSVDITGMPSPSFTPTTTAGVLTSATDTAAICTTANTATSTCRPVPTGTI